MKSLFLPGLCLLAAARLPAAEQPMRFDFGAGTAAEGCVVVDAKTLYTRAKGYGLASLDNVTDVAGKARDALQADSLSCYGPFSFITDLPEGNYDVTIVFGSATHASDTVVKSETRRVMTQSIRTAPGGFETRTITVNVHRPALKAGRAVALKDRERGVFHWDDKLILEFNGARPAVAGISIQRNDAASTVFLAGDSTVTDQPGEPWCAWGQMLPQFFPAGVAVSNHAESGLSLASFRGSRRLDKILEDLKPGDHVLIQFGHNDQKEKGEGVGAYGSYTKSLNDYIDAISAKGGKPVLVTPMYRRRFNGAEPVDTLGDFADAVRKVAAARSVPLVDLHAMSARILKALGPEASTAAYVHFKAGAYPGQKTDVKDDTHFSPYGAYLLARCVVEGIRTGVPSLAPKLAKTVEPFNPDQPDPREFFSIPPSPPLGEVRIPDGDGR